VPHQKSHQQVSMVLPWLEYRESCIWAATRFTEGF
jgi:hypothetical protein